MRKIFPYILIILVLVQLFAPFAVGLGVKNNLEVRSNKAEAMVGDKVTFTPSKSSKAIRVDVRALWGDTDWFSKDPGVVVILLDNNDKILESKNIDLTSTTTGWTSEEIALAPDTLQTGGFTFGTNIPLTPDTPYKISVSITAEGATVLGYATSGVLLTGFLYDSAGTKKITSPPFPITTDKEGSTTITTSKPQVLMTEDSLLPVCTLGNWSVGACFGIFLYKVVFQPTSFLFGLTGKLLDVSVAYSVKSSSYTSSFVTEGWGVIRDFCNMFFIFVLLYIAFGTILGLHGVKTKEMIINVVIIGLLMNFSLFATQVIIDASNIMTRVFYNSNSIKIGTTKDGKFQEQLGTQNEIKLSEALVAKINPQNLLLNASEVDNVQTNETLTSTTESKTGSGVSVSTFILVTILASIVNIVGLITFLFCSLLFISRVIGLWLAMIFSPLAFFSYTVPQMQEWEMVGWKKWWPDTIKLAFMAPVFVFFMYLIIKFLDTKLGLAITDQKDGMDFLLGIFIPFIFIMVLLMKARSIATDLSGKIGQTVTNVAKTAGGLALGGAALGTAVLGRQVVGKGLASLSRSPDAMHRATQKIAFNKDLEAWGKTGKNASGGTEKPTWEKHAKENNVKSGVFTNIGAKLNEKQMKIGGVDHARHEMDEIKKAAGLEGVENSSLSGVDKKKIEDTYMKTKQSEIEGQVRKGIGADGKPIVLKDKTTGETYIGEDAYKSAKRKEIADRVGKESSGNVDGDGNLTPTALKKVEDDLKIELSAAVKISTENKLKENFAKTNIQSQQKVGGTERLFSRANKGSYDVRDISDLKSDHREGLFSKVPIALIAGVAMGIRSGFKSSGISGGGIKVEGSFMKDLGNTISDSLKPMKVDVDLSHVGEHKSSADAHGGEGGGGHH